MRFYSTAIITLVVASSCSIQAEKNDFSRHFAGTKQALTAPGSGSPENIAQQYLRDMVQELSLTPADLDGVYIAKKYRSANNGVTHIVFRQRFQGAEVFNAEWVVNLDQDNRILNAGGSLFPAPDAAHSVPPRTRASVAARAAISAVNAQAGADFAPFESSAAPHGRHTIRFTRGPLPLDVEGAAGWFFVRGKLLPAWNFFVADTDRVHRHSVTVDDLSQIVIDNQPLTFFQSAPPTPRGMVYDQASPQPNPNPGVRLLAAPPVVPRVLKSFKGDPIASPLGWTNGTETAGNNVIAGENLLGTQFIRPTPTPAANGDFSFPIQLGAGFTPLAYPDAATTNLFYWINLAHDLHYQYGFDEQAGNFQADNLGRGGVGGDPIYAYSHFGSQSPSSGQFENAFFSLIGGSTDDGVQPEVAMFLSGAVGPDGDFLTDGSLTNDVIVHEYTHGVSSRLARQAYTNFQGRSMGEAWSDFYGMEYTIPEGAPPDGLYPTAEYFDQTWGIGAVRSRPYSTDMNLNPLTFANIGHVISTPEVHADGEIWVEALWEIRANLIKQFGEKEGRKRARQLVIDGMKLAIPSATMIDMRDAILLADRVDYKGASQSQLWAGFAKRGMGALAFSDGPDTTHVAASFDLPSATGAMRFYDAKVVIGESTRIILQDTSYAQPSVRVQVTGSSGDVEDVLLRQRGSIYVGSFATGVGTVAKSNTRLELVPGDFISAYYVDQSANGPAKLIEATIPTMAPYVVSGTPNSYVFGRESRANLISRYTSFDLPFTFPFFDRKASRVYVIAGGVLMLDVPWDASPCDDAVALRQYAAISPLWLPVSLTGSAQTNEGFFVSSTTDSMTFRWAGEYTAVGQRAAPVNFATTLFSDGRIQFNYGSGNQTVGLPFGFTQCGPAVTGISNGHYTYVQNLLLGTYENGQTLTFNPPFNKSSLPTATILTPRAGDHVQDILTVSGTAADSETFVISVDIFIDGVQRSRVVPTGSPLTWSAILDLTAAHIGQGDHTLWVRVTNGRGGFTDVPAQPITFTVDPGKASLPVAAIESPKEGDVIKGNLSVTGYAYAANLRILSVDTLVDGFVYPSTSYGATRNDICTPLTPKPLNCPAVGFQSRITTQQAFPPLPDGPHKLQIRVRDQTGRFTLYPDTPMNITVKNGPASPIFGVVESPASGAKLSGTVTVTGYVYSPGHKITAALPLVDGDFVSNPVRLAIPKPDVCASLPDADACPNIGFIFTLDTTKLLNGPHILGVFAFDNNGNTLTFPSLVNGGMNIIVDNP